MSWFVNDGFEWTWFGYRHLWKVSNLTSQFLCLHPPFSFSWMEAWKTTFLGGFENLPKLTWKLDLSSVYLHSFTFTQLPQLRAVTGGRSDLHRGCCVRYGNGGSECCQPTSLVSDFRKPIQQGYIFLERSKSQVNENLQACVSRVCHIMATCYVSLCTSALKPVTCFEGK